MMTRDAFAEQATLPLDVLAIQGALLFRAYLQKYHLHPLLVAFACDVRYFTIWNIQHGNPITDVQAAKVRAGLLALTGVPFTAPIALKTSVEPENRRRRRDFFKMSHHD